MAETSLLYSNLLWGANEVCVHICQSILTHYCHRLPASGMNTPQWMTFCLVSPVRRDLICCEHPKRAAIWDLRHIPWHPATLCASCLRLGYHVLRDRAAQVGRSQQ